MKPAGLLTHLEERVAQYDCRDDNIAPGRPK